MQPFLDRWNQEILHQAQEGGHTSGQRAALDGTLVEANASRHHLLNLEQVQQRCQVLQAACEADAQGTVPLALPYWMAHTAGTRQRQQEQYQRALTILNER